MFDQTSINTSKFVKKYSAASRIFNSLLGVWKSGQTRSFVFDIYQNPYTDLAGNLIGGLYSLTHFDYVAWLFHYMILSSVQNKSFAIISAFEATTKLIILSELGRECRGFDF